MFGEVGGLYDFLAIILYAIFTRISSKFQQATIISRLFRIKGPDQLISKPLKFSRTFIFTQMCWLRFCIPDKGKKHKALQEGIKRLDLELDVAKIVRNSRAMDTLQRLLLS